MFQSFFVKPLCGPSLRIILIVVVYYRALQAQQQELERQRITDSLKKGLSHRPDKEELVERKHSITASSNLGPCLLHP